MRARPRTQSFTHVRRRFKRDDPVEVPATLARFDRLAQGAQGQEAVYDLFAWTDHHGSDGSHGHYTAHSRHFNGSFYKCVLLPASSPRLTFPLTDAVCASCRVMRHVRRFDDDRVSKVDKPKAFFTSRSAYVLFYERRDQ